MSKTIGKIRGELINIDSILRREIGFTSDKFGPISYIIKNGKDLDFSAIFD